MRDAAGSAPGEVGCFLLPSWLHFASERQERSRLPLAHSRFNAQSDSSLVAGPAFKASGASCACQGCPSGQSAAFLGRNASRHASLVRGRHRCSNPHLQHVLGLSLALHPQRRGSPRAAGVLFAAWAPPPCRGCCLCGAAVLHSCSPSALTVFLPYTGTNLTVRIGRLSAALSPCLPAMLACNS